MGFGKTTHGLSAKDKTAKIEDSHVDKADTARDESKPDSFVGESPDSLFLRLALVLFGLLLGLDQSPLSSIQVLYSNLICAVTLGFIA
jgi:hypothetical protein